MNTLQRFNEKTGRKEFFIQPKNLPGYWTALGLCDRCYTFNKCLGLSRLSKEEWEEFENSSTNLLANLELTSCSENLT